MATIRSDAPSPAPLKPYSPGRANVGPQPGGAGLALRSAGHPALIRAPAIHGRLDARPAPPGRSDRPRCYGSMENPRRVQSGWEAGGCGKRAMDGARPSQGMDALPREEQLPASQPRTGAAYRLGVGLALPIIGKDLAAEAAPTKAAQYLPRLNPRVATAATPLRQAGNFRHLPPNRGLVTLPCSVAIQSPAASPRFQGPHPRWRWTPSASAEPVPTT